MNRTGRKQWDFGLTVTAWCLDLQCTGYVQADRMSKLIIEMPQGLFSLVSLNLECTTLWWRGPILESNWFVLYVISQRTDVRIKCDYEFKVCSLIFRTQLVLTKGSLLLNYNCYLFMSYFKELSGLTSCWHRHGCFLIQQLCNREFHVQLCICTWSLS